MLLHETGLKALCIVGRGMSLRTDTILNVAYIYYIPKLSSIVRYDNGYLFLNDLVKRFYTAESGQDTKLRFFYIYS